MSTLIEEFPIKVLELPQEFDYPRQNQGKWVFKDIKVSDNPPIGFIWWIALYTDWNWTRLKANYDTSD